MHDTKKKSHGLLGVRLKRLESESHLILLSLFNRVFHAHESAKNLVFTLSRAWNIPHLHGSLGLTLMALSRSSRLMSPTVDY